VQVPARMPDTPVAGPVVYLHGFASSPKSTKGAFFTERLRAHAVALLCPDLNAPDFETLTMTRMLQQLDASIGRDHDRPVTLMGSSLGATLAILAAERFAPRIARLVLFAPAVMFAKPGHHLLPPERIEEWHRRGALPFFHHADHAERQLKYAFYEDSLKYDAFHASVTQPTLIFQGLHDTSVDYRTVEQFARVRPNVTLSLLDDDHQLIASLPRMWDSIRGFLGLDE
jgi:pimeloyl-ACP methyl ester carboxylesterase